MPIPLSLAPVTRIVAFKPTTTNEICASDPESSRGNPRARGACLRRLRQCQGPEGSHSHPLICLDRPNADKGGKNGRLSVLPAAPFRKCHGALSHPSRHVYRRRARFG